MVWSCGAVSGAVGEAITLDTQRRALLVLQTHLLTPPTRHLSILCSSLSPSKTYLYT